MSIFRREARETTFVWAVSLDGAPVILKAEPAEVTTVRANGATIVVDYSRLTVSITRDTP